MSYDAKIGQSLSTHTTRIEGETTSFWDEEPHPPSPPLLLSPGIVHATVFVCSGAIGATVWKPNGRSGRETMGVENCDAANRLKFDTIGGLQVWSRSRLVQLDPHDTNVVVGFVLDVFAKETKTPIGPDRIH